MKIACVFISSSAFHMHDFHIFIVIDSPLHGSITNQHNDQLQVGMSAHLVEHCRGHEFKSRTGLNFFRALLLLLLQYCSSMRRSRSHSLLLSICLPDPRKTEVKVRARSFRQSDDEFEDEEISQGQIRQYFPETWIFMDDVVGYVNSFLDNISWLIMLMYNVDWISTRALKGGALMEGGRLIKGEGWALSFTSTDALIPLLLRFKNL